MPKLILAAAAFLIDRTRPARDIDAHAAVHARTRSRQAARRLRSSGPQEARPDLRALALTRRH